MILSFKNKGLEDFFLNNSKKGIIPDHAGKLEVILDLLETAKEPKDMNFPGFELHPLKGDKKGIWSVTVRANWRIIFEFEDDNIINVDYIDYH